MKAAVLTSFDSAPRYADFAEPVPQRPDELLVDVLAVGLHHLTRARASGSHYSSTVAPPLVPGVDGVGRSADGQLHYFVLDDTRFGSLAERTVIDAARSFVLPSDADPIAVAAAMNPAMGSWLALRCRVPFVRGQNVLVLGATGSSGSLAVQIARHLGAAQIIAVGRNEKRLAGLPALGATDVVKLGDARLGSLAREVDVVLDFLWGESATHAMTALIMERADRSRSLTWIDIGSMAGPSAAIPAALLRAARLQILGSGIGSVPGREIVGELPALVMEIARGTFHLDTRILPLRDVELGWSEDDNTGARIVFTP